MWTAPGFANRRGTNGRNRNIGCERAHSTQLAAATRSVFFELKQKYILWYGSVVRAGIVSFDIGPPLQHVGAEATGTTGVGVRKIGGSWRALTRRHLES